MSAADDCLIDSIGPPIAGLIECVERRILMRIARRE